jgi:GTP-binding protein HflX
VKVAIVHRREKGEESNLAELKELCKTAGYQVVYELTQVRESHPKYDIGPGKIKILKDAIKRYGIEKVILENDIKPVQEYNLAKALQVPIISRIRLILEIFSKHASSIEAKLQIKLAELMYELPRVKEKVRLAKKGEQPGFHGLGMYDAEVYYLHIKRRIAVINKKLEVIRKRRMNLREGRKINGIPLITITGYTNAGKSTLFKALTKSEVKISPLLFTTLSPKTKMIKIDGKPVFISDTIGFIKNLPTLLIEAFHSTLEEISYSDLIILITDASERIEEILNKIYCSLSILREINVFETPILLVLNKIDKIPIEELKEKEERLSFLNIPYVAISALEKINIDELINKLSSMLSNNYVKIHIVLKDLKENFSILSNILKYSKIISFSNNEEGIEAELETLPFFAEKLRSIANSYNIKS